MRHFLLAMVAALVGACGEEASAGDAGTRADGGWAANAAKPSPDGMGYCCPIGYPTCDCGMTGGFERDPADCWRHSLCDLHPFDWREEMDEHGCLYVPGYPQTECCHCAEDAGAPDASRVRDAGEGLDGGSGAGDAALGDAGP